MNVVNLNNLEGLPEKYITQLEKFKYMLLEVDFLEDLEDETQIQNLIIEINNYCYENLIIGYHYTRAVVEEILENGLLIRSGSEIRNCFIEKYGSMFTLKEIDIIKKAWESYFFLKQKKIRNNLIYFNFTQEALNNGCAYELLNFFGGEQVHMPLQDIKGISKKLSSIGFSLILKCKLSPHNLITATENPWGKIAVSTYHNRHNSNVFRKDIDGYQTIPVPAKNIEIIYKIKKYKQTHIC